MKRWIEFLTDRGVFAFIALAVPMGILLRYTGISFSMLVPRLAAGAMMALIVRELSFAGGKKYSAGIAAELLSILLLNVFLLLEIMEITSIVLSGESFNFAFYFHMNLNTLLTGSDGYEDKIILVAAFFLAVNAIYTRILFRKKTSAVAKWGHSFISVLIIAAALTGLVFLDAAPANFARMIFTYGMPEKVSAELNPRELKRYSIKPCTVNYNTLDAVAGKNIVLIYLESLEKNFTANRNFPGVMQETEKLMASPDALVLDDFESKAGFTFSSLYQSHTGCFMPEKFSADRYNENIGDRMLSLSLILKKAGYYLNYIKGGSLEFAGTGKFLKANGYDDIWCAGDKTLEKYTGKLPEGNAYGFRDHTLFEAAYRRYDELAGGKQPFCLTLLTVDCHPPNGFQDEKTIPYIMPDGKKYNLLSANHTTDHYLGKFIARLRKHPGWKNTVIFVMTDHLLMTNLPAMGERPLKPMLSETPRRLIGFALNGTKTGRIAETAYQVDVAPTLLALAGVKHNYIFPVGENMLGQVDRNRKKAFSMKGQTALEKYLRYLSSVRELDFSSGVKLKRIRDQWYLCAGKNKIAVYDAYARPELPELEHNFIVKLDGKGKNILEIIHSADPEKMREIFHDERNFYLILGGRYSELFPLAGLEQGMGNGLILAFGRKGNWKFDVKSNPSELELDDLLLPGMRLPEKLPELELSKEKIKFGETIHFNSEKEFKKLNPRRFSVIEPAGCWNDGKRAALIFEVPPLQKKYAVIRIELLPRQTPDKPLQRMIITGPGNKKSEFHLDREGGIVVPLEKKDIADGRIRLDFFFPDAAPIEGGDPRVLAFFFKTLRIDDDGGIDLNFADPAALAGLEDYGFSPDTETSGRWTAAAKAGLTLTLWRKPEKNVVFKLDMLPLTTDKIKSQIVTLRIDGKIQGKAVCSRDGVYTFTVPPEAFTSPQFKFSLDIPDASRPGNGDERTLGLFIRSLHAGEDIGGG